MNQLFLHFSFSLALIIILDRVTSLSIRLDRSFNPIRNLVKRIFHFLMCSIQLRDIPLLNSHGTFLNLPQDPMMPVIKGQHRLDASLRRSTNRLLGHLVDHILDIDGLLLGLEDSA
jgi:hypothetical protein